MFNNQILGDLVSKIFSCQSLTERFVIYNQTIQLLGFEGSAYSFIPNVVSNTQLNSPPIFISSGLFPDSFIEQYTAERLDQDDFFIRSLKQNIMHPMDWSEYYKTNHLTKNEKNLITLAKHDHGIINALSIPSMNESMGIAGFSIISSLNNREFRKVRDENLSTLCLCTKAFHNIIFSNPYRYHEFIPEALLNITEKEKMVIHFVVKGKSMAELGRSNEPISERYGEKLLLGLRKKFGGISTHELIHYVSQLRII